MTDPAFPTLRTFVLDATDARALAEFYRNLLGYDYRPGDEVPPAGEDDPKGRDWLVLVERSGSPRFAFQQVARLPRSTWPGTETPQEAHLDLTVPHERSVAQQYERALRLGAQLRLDRSDDPQERLYVYADPEGHPPCIFVAAG